MKILSKLLSWSISFRIPPSAISLCLFSFSFSILLSSCSASASTSPSPTPLPLDPSEPVSVFFTRGSGGVDALEDALLADINSARETIDIAIYNFNQEAIANALIRAAQRGVRVRLVMESDNMDGNIPGRLFAAGIPVIGDGGDGLMHNKFIIIDGEVLWTGSMNLTQTGLYSDDNNFVRFVSTQLAATYTTEFEEMFISRLFSWDSPSAAMHPIVDLDGNAIEVYFSPDDNVEDRLVRLVEQADISIIFLANTFTSDDLALAIIDRARAGVQVAGVMDDSMASSNTGTEYDRLRQAGLDVILDGRDALMHHKVIILDGDIVVMGSYNYTRSADERNDENLLIIHDPDLAALFLAEYDRIVAGSQ